MKTKSKIEKRSCISKIQQLKRKKNLIREEHRQQLINQIPKERTPTEQDFAYLGGFIDAECCFKISSYYDKRKLNPNLNYKIILECNNSKLPVFPWLLRKFGGNIYFSPKNKKHKKNRNQLTWRISCKALSKILPKVYPFLKYKQPVCKKLLDFYETNLPIGGDRQSNEFKQFYAKILLKRADIVQQVHILNTKGCNHLFNL